MKAAFWAAERGVGTTSNMLVLASLLSSEYLCRCVRAPAKKAYPPAHSKKERSVRQPAGNDGFLFIDCGNRQDQHTREILRQADLVVANLHQNTDLMNFFMLCDIHISKNIYFLISGHIGQTESTKRQLTYSYRIMPEQMGMIPYNSEFRQAFLTGGLDRFVKANRSQMQPERNHYFFRELAGISHMFVKELEKKQLNKLCL